MKEKRKLKIVQVIGIVWDVLYTLIVIPIIVISMSVIYQSIRFPEKIPAIFRYKPFIILDGKMDEKVEYGDLVFTKIIEKEKLQIGDLIAFRNRKGFVILHEITKIDQTNGETVYSVKTIEGESNDNKFIRVEQIEGIFVKRISNVGNVVLFFSSLRNLLIIILILSILGGFFYWIASILDKKEQENKELVEEK